MILLDFAAATAGIPQSCALLGLVSGMSLPQQETKIASETATFGNYK